MSANLTHINSSKDNKELAIYHWKNNDPKAIVQLIHGMSEHLGRYNHFANFLVSQGFAVVGHDQRGHGKTAKDIQHVGHVADQDGVELLVQDVRDVKKHINELYPGKKIVALGHSFGSFVLRKFSADYPQGHDAFIYSATGGHPGWKGAIGDKVAGAFKLLGRRNRNKILTSLTFGDFNKKYPNKRTEKDWLSRDNQVVDDYINDPFCMQIFSTQFFQDLANLTMEVSTETTIQNVDFSKPTLFFAGTMDPVGNYGEGVKEVANKYKHVGVKDVTMKLYEDGRHEMLNELNKEEVYQDVVDWINTKVTA